jgi:hypothetical protein
MYHNSKHSICSQEPEGESSLTFCLGTYLSGLVRLSPSPEKSCSNDSQTECSHFSRSGTTSALSTGDRGEEQLMFWPEDSPARISPPREQITERKKELTEIARDFGRSIKGLLARWNLDLSLPKTPRIFEVMALEPSCKTLPAWGMMLDGVSLEVATLVRITNGNDSGFLPTPMATDWKGGTVSIRKDRGTPRLDQWRDYVKIKYGLTYPHPTHSELRMGWPENWTDLKPLGMDKFQQWQLLHSPCYPGAWITVSFASDCEKEDDSDEFGVICSLCGGEYSEYPCPGPTQDEWDHEEFHGELRARPTLDCSLR